MVKPRVEWQDQGMSSKVSLEAITSLIDEMLQVVWEETNTIHFTKGGYIIDYIDI